MTCSRYNLMWSNQKPNNNTPLNQFSYFIKRGKMETINTQIYDRTLSLLGTGISIKSGGVKLVVWVQIDNYYQRL
jgi:hypothetical protein